MPEDRAPSTPAGTAGPGQHGKRGSHGRHGWSFHLVMVILCLGLLVVALVLARLSAPGPTLSIAGVSLPSVCAFHNATGLPCPGCGLTRSWVEMARGDLAASVAHNRMGWLLMLWVAVQLIRHGLWLVLAPARRWVEAVGGWLDRSLILIGIALVISWIVTLTQIARGAAG